MAVMLSGALLRACAEDRVYRQILGYSTDLNGCPAVGQHALVRLQTRLAAV